MNFRASRAGWVDRLPSHWSECRLRFAAAINPSKSETAHLSPDTSVSFLPMEAVGEDGSVDLSRTKPMAEVSAGYTYFRDQDVLIAKITPCFENGKAAQVQNLSNGLGFGSTEFHVLRARPELHDKFLLHLMRSAPFRDAGTASMYGAGGQKRVPTDFIADFVIPLPPSIEQVRIAAFLNCEIAKIDALIAKQTELLTRLDEHRRALTTEAVTGGLDPKAPTQESGVKWIGRVPAHWTLPRIGKYFEVQLGKMLDGARQTGQHLAPYLRVFDVQWGQINIEELPVMDFSVGDRIRFALQLGDLIVNEGGSYVGRSAIWKGKLAECYYQKALHRVRPRTSNDSNRFLYYLMFAAVKLGVFVAGGNQTTIDHLTAEQFRSYQFPRPPLDEQIAIADYLDNAHSRIDLACERSADMIERLRERRSALITAAVTGQLDVTEPALTEAAA